MVLTFSMGGVFILALNRYGSDPYLFVLLAALIFFSWGDIYSIFPALTSDQFGRKYAYDQLRTAVYRKGLRVVLRADWRLSWRPAPEIGR